MDWCKNMGETKICNLQQLSPKRTQIRVRIYSQQNKIKQLIIDFKPINEKNCKLRLKGKFFNYSIINVYAPTDEKEDQEKEVFYEEIEKTIQECPHNDIKIVIGDLNAKIGRERVYMPTIGKYSLHEESNDNGTRLIHLAASLNMVIASTLFDHKNIHKGTWVSPDGNTTMQRKTANQPD